MINAGPETRSGANKISRYHLLSETDGGYYSAAEKSFSAKLMDELGVVGASKAVFSSPLSTQFLSF